MFDLDFSNPESQGGLELSMEELVKLEPGTESTETVDTSSTETEEKGTTKVNDNKTEELQLSLKDILGDDEDSSEEEIVDKDTKPSSANKETANSFLLLHNALAEEGILNEIEEEEFNKLVEEHGSGGKAILQLMNNKLDEVETSIKDKYEEDYKEYLRLKEIGVPQEDAFNLASVNSRLDQIDDDILEESEDVRKEVLEMHFKNTTKWSDDKIAKRIEKLVIDGEDIDEAKEALPELKKFAKESIAIKEREQVEYNKKLQAQQEEAAKNIRDTFKENAEIVKNIKLTKAQATKAQELLLTPVELEDGSVTNVLYAERAKNPLEFDKKLAALIASGAFEGKVATASSAKKKAIEELDKVISSGNRSTFKGNSAATNEVMEEQDKVMNDKFLRMIGKNN